MACDPLRPMLYLPAVTHQRRLTLRNRFVAPLKRVPLVVRAYLGAPPRRSVLVLLACLAGPLRLQAHEIPERVAVMGFVRAEGTRLEVLLRVPLVAMRDVDFPLRPDGSLDLVKVRPLLTAAAQVWLADYLTLEAAGRPLDAPRVMGSRVALPSDRGFGAFADARAQFDLPPLGDGTSIAWQQAMLDVRLEYILPDADAPLMLRPRLAHLGVRTISVLHVLGADGTDRVLTYEGNPDRIALDPQWYDAARQFIGDGFRHILGGIDHLLFILCLVLPVRRWRSLVAIITAFTLAHSLTLGFAAFGLAPTAGWFPPLVEMLIAASIVWLTVENIVLPADRLAHRWMMAFGFGLIHGFGFSFALGERLQFAGGHLLAALASFNVGVELGQLLVLALALPLLGWLHGRVGADRERMLTIVGSALVAHTAWHWMTERAARLAEYRGSFGPPAIDATFGLDLMRFALLAALALALALALRQILRTVWRP